MTHSATMSRAQSCPTTTTTPNPAKPPSPSIQRRLQTNARLCHLAQSMFGSQGIQDLAIVGVLFGNNIQQIGRFQIQCNGTMAQGQFSIHELVNSRVLSVTGRSKKGRQAARRRRQKKKRHTLSMTDQDMPLTSPSKNHHQLHQQQRPILTPTLLAELFPLVVYRTIRKHTRRDRARLGAHGSFFSPALPSITASRLSSSSRPPSITPGTTGTFTAQTAAVASTSSSSFCVSQEPWSFGSLTPLDKLAGEANDYRERLEGETSSPSFSSDNLLLPGDDELLVSSPEVLRRLFQRCLFHVPDLPLPDELCFLAAALFPLPQALRALHVAWTIEFLKHRVRTERRSRQQERRLATTLTSSPNSSSHPYHHHHTHHHRHPSSNLFQPSPEMNTVMEEEADEEEEKENAKDQNEHKPAAVPTPTATTPQHVAASHCALAATKPACLGGLEFQPQVYAYKMRLARAVRARSTKSSSAATHHESTTTTPAAPQSAANDATITTPTTTTATKESAYLSSSRPVVDTTQAVVDKDSSNSGSSSPTIDALMFQYERERPDKRLMQQLLSLENKIPRIVRKWAHHARLFFAEELMREDSLAQKWVDEQRIEVVLGTGCHGHFTASASSLQQQQQQRQQSTMTTSGMSPSSTTPPPVAHLAQQSHANSSQYQQEQPHATSAEHMQQQQQQQLMINTTHMHTTTMMTTTTHSPRLITGGTTPVTTSTPRATSFAEGIRLNRQGSSSHGSADFSSLSTTTTTTTTLPAGASWPSSSPPPPPPPCSNTTASATAATVHRTSLRSSVNASATTGSTYYPYHHRASTSQQLLSLHLWLSCLVSPISPDQMVHEGFFEPLDPRHA